MARTTKPRHRTAATDVDRAAVDPHDELRRTLERDTSVQGERTEEAVADSRSPSGADGAPPAGRPAGTRKTPPK